MTRTLTKPELRPAACVPTARYVPPAADPRIRLRLDRNEGPPAPFDGAALDAERLRCYPDATCLEARLAAQYGLSPAHVLATAGGDDGIDRVCRALLEPGRTLVLPTPTFPMFTHGARIAGAAVRGVPWPDGAFPLDDLCTAIDATTGLVAVVTPNNPTGLVAPPAALDAVAERAADVGAVLLVDAAYVEFAGHDPTARLARRSGVVVVRTFSKAWGLAGVRLGVLLGDPRVLEWARAIGGPYAVSGPALALADLALDAPGVLRTRIVRIRAERRELARRCAAFGLRPLRSFANFVTVRPADPRRFVAALAERGIAVRGFSGADTAGLVRITCPGAPDAFDELLAVLAAVSDTGGPSC